MITKKIIIEFADPNIRAIDHIKQIREASVNAGLNLFSRYDVRLQYPMPYSNDRVAVDIDIPDDIVSNFSVGNHLRGISNYLLKNYEELYTKYLVGKRLFNYVETTGSIPEEEQLGMVDRLEAIVLFSKLLERSDTEAMISIRKVLNILHDVVKEHEILICTHKEGK